jgi:hypothetical protein
MSTPKPAPVAKIATPEQAERVTQVEANAEVEATQADPSSRRNAASFNLKLPSSFQIPL